MTVPAATLEMTPMMRPEANDLGRGEIIREITRRQHQGRGRRGADNVLNAEAQLWWIDEWSRPDGLYGLRTLTSRELDRYDELIEHIPLDGFIGAPDRESLRALVDAQIVCETLAIDGHLLLTHDPNTIKPERLLPWTQALADEGWISEPKVVEEADDANTRWVEETPEDMLLGTIVCAWPQETDAPASQMNKRIADLTTRLAKAGLPRTATKLTALVDQTNSLAGLIERVGQQLPVEMRNAERRSPCTVWTGAPEKPRNVSFRLNWTGSTLCLVHQSLNGDVHQWGEWAPKQFGDMERASSPNGTSTSKVCHRQRRAQTEGSRTPSAQPLQTSASRSDAETAPRSALRDRAPLLRPSG